MVKVDPVDSQPISYVLPATSLYTVGERLGENRIFGFPQKYVKTTQDSTQMTFGCQI